MHFTPPFHTSEQSDIQSLIQLIGAHDMASIICADKKGLPYSSFLPVDFKAAENTKTNGEIGCAIFHTQIRK